MTQSQLAELLQSTTPASNTAEPVTRAHSLIPGTLVQIIRIRQIVLRLRLDLL